MRARDGAIAGAVALGVAFFMHFALAPRLDGLSIDLLFWLRHIVESPSRSAEAPKIAIVALDEETERRAPFADVPRALWTPEVGAVLDALVTGGAKAVGFDVVFPTSVDSFVPGYDRPFLLALRRAAESDRVVLGEVQHQLSPIHPYAAQIFVVGPGNLRAVNELSDPDSVVRRVPLFLERRKPDGTTAAEPSMALELAARALGQPATRLPDGEAALGDMPIAGAVENASLLNFRGLDRFPTYSFADLYACAQGGNGTFFRDHFAGRVVLLGAMLDVEDRELTSARFITGAEHPSDGARCVNPPMDELFRGDLVRETIPGVLVLATALDNLMTGTGLAVPVMSLRLVLTGLMAGAGAILAFAFSPLWAALVLGVLALGWAGIALTALARAVALPLLAPVVASALTLVLLIGYRFAVSDRDRRLLRNSFSLYLAPALVDRLVKAERMPALGGEIREVSVLFADLAAFTALAEDLPPAELVEIMNRYLTAMTDAIEAESGFVDKYIGDAIVAIFGAPLDDPRHGEHAVRAALRCQEALGALNRAGEAFAGRNLRMRIGVSSGEALVGNIGSRRRFNYTVMGDTVNLAARLEGANKIYGTTILAGDATRQAAGPGIAWRDIDLVTVMGRAQPVRLFTPLMDCDSKPVVEAFATGLELYRAGRFAEALSRFAPIAERDPVAAAFVQRIERWSHRPPSEPWLGVTALDTK